MPNSPGSLIIEDAQLRFLNFEGKEGMYNREGDRNFCVLLEPELADALIADGWNVKHLKPLEDEEVGTPYIQVSVGYKFRPPQIVLISSRGRVNLGQHECEVLDWVDMKQVDISIRPRNWSVGGKNGIKAYLKAIYVTLNEDALDLKYADVPVAELEPGGKPLMIESANVQRPSEDIVDGELVD